MKIDFRTDPQHAFGHVVLDRATGEVIDDAMFFADDVAGVYHAYLRGRPSPGERVMAFTDDRYPMWREVHRPIRIELKGKVGVVEREAKVYVVTETWCDDEGRRILGAFSTRDRAEAWKRGEIDLRVAVDPGSDGLSDAQVRSKFDRVLDVVGIPLDPARGLEESSRRCAGLVERESHDRPPDVRRS